MATTMEDRINSAWDKLDDDKKKKATSQESNYDPMLINYIRNESELIYNELIKQGHSEFTARMHAEDYTRKSLDRLKKMNDKKVSASPEIKRKITIDETDEISELTDSDIEDIDAELGNINKEAKDFVKSESTTKKEPTKALKRLKEDYIRQYGSWDKVPKYLKDAYDDEVKTYEDKRKPPTEALRELQKDYVKQYGSWADVPKYLKDAWYDEAQTYKTKSEREKEIADKKIIADQEELDKQAETNRLTLEPDPTWKKDEAAPVSISPSSPSKKKREKIEPKTVPYTDSVTDTTSIMDLSIEPRDEAGEIKEDLTRKEERILGRYKNITDKLADVNLTDDKKRARLEKRRNKLSDKYDAADELAREGGEGGGIAGAADAAGAVGGALTSLVNLGIALTSKDEVPRSPFSTYATDALRKLDETKQFAGRVKSMQEQDLLLQEQSARGRARGSARGMGALRAQELGIHIAGMGGRRAINTDYYNRLEGIYGKEADAMLDRDRVKMGDEVRRQETIQKEKDAYRSAISEAVSGVGTYAQQQAKMRNKEKENKMKMDLGYFIGKYGSKEDHEESIFG